MNELYLMVAIVDRSATKKFISLYKQCGVDVTLIAVGSGTAVSETLDYLGLDQTEKAVILSIVTKSTWKTIKKQLEHQIKIDIPGTGIAFTIQLSSIGGKQPLFFFTENQNFEKGEESTLKDTKYELLIVIANQGYTDLIMDAAREENASGGTIIHARGTGMARAEKFLGVSLANEKELVLLVVHSATKNHIMKAIMEKAGATTKAQSIVFSLPVTSTAGMRLMEETTDEDDLPS